MDGANKGVAIAFDSRHMSKEFAEEAARCLAANRIKAYIVPLNLLIPFWYLHQNNHLYTKTHMFPYNFP